MGWGQYHMVCKGPSLPVVNFMMKDRFMVRNFLRKTVEFSFS